MPLALPQVLPTRGVDHHLRSAPSLTHCEPAALDLSWNLQCQPANQAYFIVGWLHLVQEKKIRESNDQFTRVIK